MSDNKKMQDTNTNECNNRIEEMIITITNISVNTQYLSNKKFDNNSESQGELFQLNHQYFNKINLKEINPITISNEREKISFEKGFDIIVDEINDLIFKSFNKGIDKFIIGY
uniref:Uncharacterized protein n=1 Tax=Rhizophagus irregularis (strain DAOM 181602 / DAOM 197198 / MUCL 43194) TaxID=747089 RepID=U9UDI1_RHIID